MTMILKLATFSVFLTVAFVLSTLAVSALQLSLFAAFPLLLLAGLVSAWGIIVLVDFE